MPVRAILALFVLALLVLTVPWAIRYNRARLAQARRTLAGAVAAQGWDLVRADLCWLPRGPFASAIATHVPVYRVTARDRKGRLHRGWICCVPFRDAAETFWEEA
ncbi:hypothetical protein [Mesoterricola sediminis]|uniref:DUF3301 domain-containing protein n=1 Tax=Mesoterricola sediminis TaxID=2927980 RepID=A0AA48H0Z6_9BACT|nr:hypothetical protein [Mesoterricola sediminis]BDU77627.1 hypothetical protein METESE_25850 [Mesoterricola sediminis]